MSNSSTNAIISMVQCNCQCNCTCVEEWDDENDCCDNDSNVTANSQTKKSPPNDCCCKYSSATVRPIINYLELCFKACTLLGDDYVQNFMDYTLLADGKTTVRQYLKQHAHIEQRCQAACANAK